jgi:SAM-dependent methyltransferase
MNIWDTIYKNYQNGGLAWASLKDGLHPDFVEFVEHANFEIKNALDIGCGDGKYLLFLLKLGFQVTGLDSSPTAISMARKAAKNSGNFVVADMFEYSYPLNTYDLVISHAALHHGIKTKVISSIAKIYSTLLTGGNIFLSLPSEECKWNWATMAGHETLADGTCIPVRGPEKGLSHSFFSNQEIIELFADKYDDLSIKIDDRDGKWVITGQKKRA